MSDIILGVLRMPDALFWSVDPVTRQHHNQVRLEAADQLEQLGSHAGALQSGAGWDECDRQALLDALRNLYRVSEAALAAGDWQVDGATDPHQALARAAALLETGGRSG